MPPCQLMAGYTYDKSLAKVSNNMLTDSHSKVGRLEFSVFVGRSMFLGSRKGSAFLFGGLRLSAVHARQTDAE